LVLPDFKLRPQATPSLAFDQKNRPVGRP
jgi:hypothetical protein